ncbi:MAG: hypothetical protein JW701_00480 [Kosmotogaceae bacterium]|nr:hypothetical protein [Kosmotogaceae bacterium]
MSKECDSVKIETEGKVKALHFGVRGPKAERDFDSAKSERYKKRAKVVKSKKKISHRLKMQLLKNHGFHVKDN